MSPEKLKSYAPSVRARGKRVAGLAPVGRGRDRRAARIRQLEQPPDLVEGLPGRVVDRLAEQRVAPVVVHQDQLRVPAAHHEAEQRKRRARAEAARPAGASVSQLA